jgi:hypothetical protein
MGGLRWAVMVAAAGLLGACNNETLFKSNFDQGTVGQPPAAAQAVGTAALDGPPGAVVISQVAGQNGKWVKITRSANQTSVSGFQGNLSPFKGDGSYTFATTMFMPSGAGVATVQFEKVGQPASQPLGFLHLDFLGNNQVRIDDDEGTKFGVFPRNKPFIVQVSLNIANPSTAHIVLAGDGASGTADRTIQIQTLAHQFGAVRLWMGFPHTGSFHAANVSVTRKKD